MQRIEHPRPGVTAWAATRRGLLVLAVMGRCVAASAHGPALLRVTETVEVAAPADAVWKSVGRFSDSRWNSAVRSVTADRGDECGSVRMVYLRNGGRLVEKLEARSDDDRSLGYELQEADGLPVSQLRATMTVKASGGASSVVEWSSTFMRADRSPRPEPGLGDEDALRAVRESFKSGLQSLKAAVEQR